ncbi:MAG: FixH family protein [Verrucomicrobia bacterium]|nr:FixH family protein [Verrucomicrobiota bacterium]
MKNNPWPLFLTIFILLFVATVVGFVIWSLGHRVDLVSPEYYEQEIRYQDRIDSEARTARLGSMVGITHVKNAKSLIIQIPDNHSEAEGSIILYRPSDKKLDRQLDLAVDQNGRQTVDLSDLQSGMWRARLSWRVTTNDYYLEDIIFLD